MTSDPSRYDMDSRSDQPERRRAPTASSLLDLATDGIFTFLPSGRINYWTPSAARLWGWSAPEAVGRDAEELLQPTFDLDRPRSEIVHEALREGGWSGRIIKKRKDGSEVIVQARWFLLGDENNQPTLIASVNQDVTELVAALARDATKGALLDLASEAIFTVSLPDFRINYWNAGATRMYGWSPEEAIGETASELFKTEGARPRSSIVDELVLSGAWSGTLVQTGRDGTRIPVESRCVLHTDQSGRADAILEVNRDLSGQHAAEAAKSDFLNLVGHELRTPVTVIKSYVSAMSSGSFGEIPAACEAPLSVIYGRTLELERLVESVIVVVRSGRQSFRSRTRAIDLRLHLKNAIKRARARARTPLEINFERPSRVVMVRANAHAVGIILDSLLDNAIGHSTSDAAVDMWITDLPHPSVHIRDHGIGISAEDAPLVFERFGRRNLPQLSRRRGLGLGLYAGKRLAMAMGGDLALESSSAGQGSTFTLSLQEAATAGQSNRSIRN